MKDQPKFTGVILTGPDHGSIISRNAPYVQHQVDEAMTVDQFMEFSADPEASTFSYRTETWQWHRVVLFGFEYGVWLPEGVPLQVTHELENAKSVMRAFLETH